MYILTARPGLRRTTRRAAGTTIFFTYIEYIYIYSLKSDKGTLQPRGERPPESLNISNDDFIITQTYLVVRGGDALEDLKALHGLSSAGSLVGQHAAHHTPEDAAVYMNTEMRGEAVKQYR